MELVEVIPERLHMLRFPIGQAYLWRDGEALTLIDAGHAGAADPIEDAIRSLGLRPDRLERIVLTHCHRDHTGAAGELADRWGAQVLAHRLDAPVIRGERPVPEPVLLDWELPLWEKGLAVPEAPPTRVDREVEDGEILAFGDGAVVVHAPGHTPGSIGVHLPRHGVLFTGDCVAGVGQVMLGVFNVDRAQAQDSFRRLAALSPSVACFGHGDPLTTATAATLHSAAHPAPLAP
ncbi:MULTISPECIES: MBL fold metallo-hydrolase [unclassified Streptomyces]|uniref:MBL fold metallo-hydrolase n=1 Tax=unclassified Streptomyces TaxID=2593676 RepID=UPI001BE6CE92|nr:MULTISPECIES: MBL fold metallo-hydrolase [unclassified Streptomyces]MBT2408536.1 MBL fold metallo-hydrolase [Streptomyces sp. ISL-21]MBT2456693.1 MBL fold metallo-hydrolase [Streptomyces sp. ISL-86]MBT2612255.1 MBL fold metallo-hydrolase [Streptomyces sp. ISL-87]